jgi:benzoate-CoA ligase
MPDERLPASACNAAEALLGAALARNGGRDPALVDDAGTLSYADLDHASSRHGNALRDLGVTPGERVLLLLKDSPTLFMTYLGAMKLGAVPVALNLRLTSDNLLYTLHDSAARVLVLDPEFVPLLEPLAGRLDPGLAILLGGADAGNLPGLAPLAATADDMLEPAPLAADDAACWLYSSGTTGDPKAVVHLQRSIPAAERHLGELLDIGPGDRLFCTSKLFFAFALGHAFFTALRRGATSVLLPGWPSPEAVAEAVTRHRPTVFFSVPAFYRALLQSGLADAPAFREIRHFVAAGEKLPALLSQRWRDLTGKPILEGIGSTETLYLYLANRPDRHRAGRTGLPTPGAEVRLVDEAGTTVTAPGTPGELWVRMPSIAARYQGLPDKSAAAFVDGWYRSGDTFAVDDDGWYEHLGRADDMLKISGQWVSPSEIEEAVLLQPGIAEAAVVGAPDGDGLVRLALFLVLQDDDADQETLERDLLDALRARLSIYKCPRRVFYLDAMPATATGKVRRVELRAMAAASMRAAATD